MCNNADACGKDVLGTADIESIVNEKKSKINVFVISENDIASISKICAAKLKPVAQSNQVHQIVWSKEKKNTLEFIEMRYRSNMLNVYFIKLHAL